MMKINRTILIVLLLTGSMVSSAQIESFIGGSITPGISKVRSSNSTFSASYGGGFSYVFWDNPAWYVKSGLEYYKRTSGIREIPKHFTVPPAELFVPVEMVFEQSDLVIPIQAFFPFRDRKGNALLLAGGLEVMYTIQQKYQHDVYGDAVFSGADINTKVNTGIMFGAGYQREISDDLYFNVFPSFNFDIRSDKVFSGFELTLEILYGVY